MSTVKQVAQEIQPGIAHTLQRIPGGRTEGSHAGGLPRHNGVGSKCDEPVKSEYYIVLEKLRRSRGARLGSCLRRCVLPGGTSGIMVNEDTAGSTSRLGSE